MEAEHVTKDNQVIPVELSTNVASFKGKIVFNSIARDITERRLAELQIKEKNRRD